MITAALLASCAPPVGGPGRENERGRPNFLILYTDDQWLESMRVMPNVKRLLADRGVTFETSLASLPVCCPSRATLLTGQYAHNHGVLGNNPPLGGYRRLDSGALPPRRVRER